MALLATGVTRAFHVAGTLPGEGEIAMLMGNTITLKQAMLPAKVVIVNNGTLGSVDWR